jgi:ATP diphosphatase
MTALERLLDIMTALRHPATGCPWDREQTFATIAPYTIEEAYEVADAIERGDTDDLKDELGDLLLQVVYHAEMAREQALFDFGEVAAAIGDKLVRRHPHVFCGESIGSVAAQTEAWERHKARERSAKANGANSTLAGVTIGLPALTRAVKLQQRAARVGFDWDGVAPVLDKIEEELQELRAELAAGDSHTRIADELGDLLFAVANLARQVSVDPERAVRGANRKFERRFARIEQGLAEEGKRPEEASLEEMDSYWDAAKREGM